MGYEGLKTIKVSGEGVLLNSELLREAGISSYIMRWMIQTSAKAALVSSGELRRGK